MQNYHVYPEALFALNPTDTRPIFSVLTNPLESQIGYATAVTEKLNKVEESDNTAIGNRILESIRDSMDAEFVFMQAIEEVDSEKSIIYKYQSGYNFKGADLEEYKSLAMRELYSQLTRKKKELLPSKYGFFKAFEERKDAGKYIIAIPLRLEYPREFLVICGANHEQLKYGEIIGRVLKAVYESTKEFTSFQLLDVEMDILDSIKRDFGHVPLKIYNYRFEKFKEKLKDVYFAYEPVVELGKRNPEIQSWEALAREPNTKKAPVRLFKAAELWGPEFITELDIYCLKNSIATYLQLWKDEHRHHNLDPLAVNVYPDTIFREAYKNELGKILEEEQIRSRQLVLEISEKRPIPTIDRIREHVFGYFDPVEEFRKKISEYINDFKVGFAIDDFGVGHSSISRLSRLNLDHVKIDRDILLSPYPEHTIDYVKTSVNARNLHPEKIIVEGFDGESRISLKKLYEHGIRLVQGHMIRRASPTVSHLNDEEREFIIEQLTVEETFNRDD